MNRRLAPVIDLRKVRKTYGHGEATVHAVDGVTLAVERGDYVAIMGASGSGKSTMMNIIGCLDEQTAGSYRLDGVDVRLLDEAQQSKIRNRKIGFVFQTFNLIAAPPPLANVELPLAYAGVPARARRQRALAALDLVGLSDPRGAHLRPAVRRQQQRVAIAGPSSAKPVLLLADEPTGALDSHSTEDVPGPVRPAVRRRTDRGGDHP